jgi:hypothetical protein
MMWPESAGGWWAIGAAVVGLGSWVVLPIITLTFRTRYPVTDTWIMPVIGAVMVGVAAAVNVLCLWRWDRSTLNVVATAVTVLAALGATVILLASPRTDD